MDAIRELAADLADQAHQANQRRLLVLHGQPSATRRAAIAALEAASIEPSETAVVGSQGDPRVPGEPVDLERSAELLGTTHAAVVFDAHQALDPDALGRTVGAVDGGGLYLLLTPPLSHWPETRDGFDDRLAAPPFDAADVAGLFRSRLVGTLVDRPGVAIADADADEVGQRPQVKPDRPGQSGPGQIPERASFSREIYEATLTGDQMEVVHGLEALLDPGSVAVVEADRGRGKSSAAGLAAAGLLARGKRVLVTAPNPRNAVEVFARVREAGGELGLGVREEDEGRLLEAGEGQLVYRSPPAAVEAAGEFDAVLVDEAAGIPVHVLSGFLDHRTPIAFVTTIHGYEGAGRGFSVRLQDELARLDRPVHRFTMEEPIRYAEGDPLEAWSFEALLLDAEPAGADEIPQVEPKQARYRSPTADQVVEDEELLREAFGLLVLAHYRTRPSDLARLLDAPNVSVRCLTVDDHVVSVALMAREGGLPAALRASMYEGQRVRGNMIPDVLTSQLRDEQAGEPVGWRVLRIATHPDRRREGYASRLLEEIEREADADWLGTSYGATPGLLSFWSELGYRTVHLSTRRNEASGEHSALMLKPLSEAGRELTQRSEAWLIRRIGAVLADALDDLDPDVVRWALASVEQSPELDLGDREWRTVAAAAFGPGVYDAAPGPFRQLALRHLVDGEAELEPPEERLLVCKVMQARRWDHVTEELDYVSKRMAMRALGGAMRPIVETYGGEVASEETGRYR